LLQRLQILFDVGPLTIKSGLMVYLGVISTHHVALDLEVLSISLVPDQAPQALATVRERLNNDYL